MDCGVYRDGAPGVDLRAGFDEHDLLRSQRESGVGPAQGDRGGVENGDLGEDRIRL